MLPMERVRQVVERHFRVYESREERAQGEVMAHLFFVMFPQAEFDTRFEAVKQEIQALGPELLVFMRQEGGEDILFVATRPPVQVRRSRTNVVLLVLTLVTTIMAGTIAWAGYSDAHAIESVADLLAPQNLLWGLLTFALPLMAILGIHEMAHYFAARRHGLRSSLPFFIPVPPLPGLLPFGTLGAFISMKDPLPDRKALFDVGASGPIAGFLVAVPVVIAGAWLTSVVAEPIPDLGRPELDAGHAHVVEAGRHGDAVLRFHEGLSGTTWFRATAPPEAEDTRTYFFTLHAQGAGGSVREEHALQLEPGESKLRTLHVPDDASEVRLDVSWEDGIIEFGDPLLVKGLAAAGLENDGFLTHPMYMAGWAGLLVTGINLLPIGQLDGGHVARAVFGERTRFVAYGAVFLLLGLVFLFQSWLLMALFVLLIGVQHPPPLNDRTVLDRRRVVFAVLVLLVFAVTFVPRPIIL